MIDRDDLPRAIMARLDDPIALCSTLGLMKQSKRQRGGVTIRCPAHDDSSPSCSVHVGPEGTLRWKCFSCSAGGNALHLIAAVHGLDIKADFVKVLAIAADLAGIRIDDEDGRERVTVPPPRQRPESTKPSTNATDEDFAKVIAPLQHTGELDGRGAGAVVCDYLAGRGLLDAARADGWFSIRPSAGRMLSDMFGLELVTKCGLVDDHGELKWPDHALAIPWRTRTGEIQTIQRRHLGECDAKRRYVFPTGRGPAWPFGVEHVTGKGPVAIVEGAMDVLAWRVAAGHTRYETPIGVAGVNGWKGEWDALVPKRIVSIAYDDDDAGNREALKLTDRLYAAGAARVRRAKPASGANDWAEGLRRAG